MKTKTVKTHEQKIADIKRQMVEFQKKQETIENRKQQKLELDKARADLAKLKKGVKK